MMATFGVLELDDAWHRPRTQSVLRAVMTVCREHPTFSGSGHFYGWTTFPIVEQNA